MRRRPLVLVAHGSRDPRAARSTRALARAAGARRDVVVRALQRRRPEAGPGPVDGLVLAAAGTRDESALTMVDLVAQALGGAAGVPCLAGYASGVGRTTAEAVRALQADGAG